MNLENQEKELARIEAEAGCELAELSDPSLSKRARRLLDCDDPPQGDDFALCCRLACSDL